MDKPMSSIAFKGMSLLFSARDLIRPPKPKLMEIGIKPGSHVLDYGCGPGTFSIAAAEIVGESGKVFAVDIHPGAIETVQRKAANKGIRNIETVCAGSPTELETESIDVVILYDIYHDFTGPDAIMRELHRVMKPDAVLSFSDHHMKDEAILSGITGNGLFILSAKGKRTYSFAKAAKTE